MRSYREAWLLIGIVGIVGVVCSEPPENVYLFDCGGNVRHLVTDAPVEGRSTHVANIDTTLPDRVRDGCSILAGWYESRADNLVLRVQTVPWMDQNGALPTKLLWVTPALERAPDQERSSAPPQRPDAQSVWDALPSIRSPFTRSAGYVSPDGTTLLLQELSPSVGSPNLPIALRASWQAGTVELNPANADATGRYALVDLTSGAQRGAVVTAPGAGPDDHVVCISPGGRIYVATARDTLVVLDVAAPERRASLGDLGLDLFWTACATR